ncbi:four helix bundle protein [Flagellimonas flava]|uniref:Four helix bundle protein n=1 Tax=Flagellimonas flava TaxID=570519 RepID=A0A1M5Q0T0_9FLAO|nr:four helix bundle protein [Allomuricauda flava]SHH07103.1 four helix bundle protein [Allomuricauda flava]
MDKGFEQLVSWQRARKLNKEIHRLTSGSSFSWDFALQDQIRRASISVSSNIAEGFGRKSKKEFIYFLNVAKASCYEVKSQLYLAIDANYITAKDFEKTYAICEEISKTIYGLIQHLKNKN